jgi:hypothetical protein
MEIFLFKGNGVIKGKIIYDFERFLEWGNDQNNKEEEKKEK